MKLLFIGDVVGDRGIDFLEDKIYSLKKEHSPDVIVINGENAANGNGVTEHSLKRLVSLGADVITTGNHAFSKRDSAHLFDSCDFLLRPANYPDGVYGKGVCVLDLGKSSVAVINLQGTVYLDSLDNPFLAADRIIESLNTKNIFVDFHAEATAEKKAMGNYLRGRVTAVMGTHTHVQTADETILKEGTAYITDVGMTGAEDSVLGVESDIATEKFVTHYPVKFEISKNPQFLNAIIIEFDGHSGKATKIERIIKR